MDRDVEWRVFGGEWGGEEVDEEGWGKVGR